MNRMFKYFCAASLLAFAVLAASAQDDRHKFEVYGGYSYLRADVDVDHVNANGFEGSLTGNFHRYVGAKFDFSTHSKTYSFNSGTATVNAKLRANQYLFGVQFKDNKEDGGRLRPFAHVLAGVANSRATISGATTGSASDNNFAMVFGGGLDINASRHVAIRLIQADYNPVFSRGSGSNNTANNFRLGFGIVFH